MLDEKTAKLVFETVNRGDGNHYGNIITLEDAKRMEEIKISEEGGYVILAFQTGDLTILVRVSECTPGMKTARVQFACW